jgi:putative PEP-CTERM system TPR-repeat lipoprotein
MSIACLRKAGHVLLLCGLAWWGSPAASQPEVEAHYEAARQRYAEANPGDALAELNKALQINPLHVRSLALAGELRLQLRQYERAEQALNQALVLGGESPLVVVLLAEAYVSQGRFNRALRETPPERAAGDRFLQARLLGLLAAAQLGLNRPNAARSLLRQAEALDPDARSVRRVRVSLLLREGRLEEATAIAAALAAMPPPDARDLTAFGELLHLQGRHGAALEVYDRALALEADYPPAQLDRVGLLLDRGDAAAALRALSGLAVAAPRAACMRADLASRQAAETAAVEWQRQCVSLAEAWPVERLSSDAQTSVALGRALIEQKDYRGARLYLQNFLRLTPGHAPGVRLLALALIKQAQNPEALKLLRDLEIDQPDDAVARSLMATALHQLGEHERAVLRLEDLADRYPADAVLAARLARGRILAGEESRGISDLALHYRDHPEQEEIGLALLAVYLTSGDHRAAESLAANLIRRFPDNPAYPNLLGISLLRREAYPEALTVLEPLARSRPGFLPARLNLARTLLASGAVDAAGMEADALQNGHPQQADVLLLQARLQAARGDTVAAELAARAALGAAPRRLDTRVFLIEHYLRQGATARALSMARDGDDGAEDIMAARATLGLVQARTDNRQGAAATYSSMSADAGFRPDLLVRIARLQMDVEAWDRAGYTLKKALTGDPQNRAANRWMIEVNMALQDYEAALDSSLSLAEAAPGDPLWPGLAGTALLALGRTAEAQTALRQSLALEHDPLVAAALYRALRSAGDSEQAMTLLSSITEEHPDDQLSRRVLVDALWQAGRLDAARAQMHELLRAQPDDARLLNNMANIDHAMGGSDALDYARRAYELAPDNPRVNDTLGWLLVEAGRPQDGLRYLRLATLRLADAATIRYHLAVALHRMGRSLEAARELKAALSRGAGESWYPEALRIEAQLESGGGR